MNIDLKEVPILNNDFEEGESILTDTAFKFSQSIQMDMDITRKSQKLMSLLITKKKRIVKDFMEIFKWEGKSKFMLITCL